MKYLLNLSIKYKIVLITLSTTALALIIGFSSVVRYGSLKFRDDMEANGITTGRLIATACISPLIFFDNDGAEEALGALTGIPNVGDALLFDGTGSLFAKYSSASSSAFVPVSPRVHSGGPIKYSGSNLLIYSPIEFQDELLGTLILRISTSELGQQIWDFRQNVSLLGLAILSIAFFASMRLQRIVSLPIMNLADFTEEISQSGDYSRSISKIYSDEIGTLYDRFNTMIRQISTEQVNRDRAEMSRIEAHNQLEELNKNLEGKVFERTQELEINRNELRKEKLLSDAVLASMEQGLLAYDENLNLILANDRYREILDVPEEVTRVGTPFEELIRFNVARHEYGEIDEEAQVMYQINRAKKFEPHNFERERRDGTIIEVVGGPLRGGGFVSTFTDITERRRLSTELKDAAEVINEQKQRMESELNVGKEIQMGMLPGAYSDFPDTEYLALYASLTPAREVGGDFYDYYFVGDDYLYFSVGDVSGKGVGAALYMAMTKTLLKARSENDISTASIATHLNEELSKNNERSMFITLFIGILDIKSGWLRYTNAGHNRPFVVGRNDNSCVRLDKLHGPPIAAIMNIEYNEDMLKLSTEDKLFVYTDGITEAMDIEKNLFGEERLINYLRGIKHQSISDDLLGIFGSINSFSEGEEQSDDVTALLLHSKSENLGGLNISIVNDLSNITQVTQAFREYAKLHHYPDRLRNEVIIILDEIINNTISYSFDDDGTHKIEIEIEEAFDSLFITIMDDGGRFDPFKIEAPNINETLEDRKSGGLGILLVKSMVTNYSYERVDSKNIVVLTKLLAESTAKESSAAQPQKEKES